MTLFVNNNNYNSNNFTSANARYTAGDAASASDDVARKTVRATQK